MINKFILVPVDVTQVLLTGCLERTSHVKKQIKYFCIILSWGFFFGVKYCKLQSWNDFSSYQQYCKNFTCYYRTTAFTWSNLSSSCSDIFLFVSFLIPWIGWHSSFFLVSALSRRTVESGQGGEDCSIFYSCVQTQGSRRERQNTC